MLLMALPNEHLLTFSQYKDAKTLFEAIQARFGGCRKLLVSWRFWVKTSLKKILKFLRSLPAEWNTYVVVWRNKADLDTMSIDDLYNNFKIVEQEVKRTVVSSSSSGSLNMAILSSPGSTNEVDTASIQVSAASTLVSTVSSPDSTANLSDATVYAFLENQPNGSQLVHEDLEQIHKDDREEMDLKWQLVLLSMRARRYFQRTSKRITINESDTAGYDKTKESRQLKKTMIVEDTSSKVMVAIDSACFDWSYMVDDEVPTNKDLMAFSDSEHPEFKGYGHKDSKSVCIDTSNEIKKALDASIIIDWVSDSNENESEEMVLKTNNVQHKPEQANQPRNFSQNPRNIKTKMVQKHVLKNVEKGTGQRIVKPVLNNAIRTNHQNFSNPRRNFAPIAVLTKFGIVPISTARQISSRAAAPVSAARPINIAASKPLVNVAKPRQNALQTTHSLSKRPFYQQIALKNRNLNNNVNAAKANYVNTAKGNKVTSVVGNQGINAVKSSARWVWRPKIKVQDHVSKNSGSYICKHFDYVDPEGRLKSEIYPTSLTLRSTMEEKLKSKQKTKFQQKFDESFHEAWERYKDLLRACPHHGFTELHQLDTFYNALNPADQDSLNAAAGGNLLEKSPQDALTIIENKSKVRNSRSKPIASPVNACDNHSSYQLAKLRHAVNQQTSVVTTAITAMLKQLQSNPPPAQVKAVEEIYVTCGGAHPYYQCLAVGGNTFPEYWDNIQGYVLAATSNFN
uniref:Ribonuclease H-like domain-containing protein n=1 Tax=Tanacetum cinerariifolium TaxID=118510 RepID=A0A699HFF0_TANCI|nr:ribonuclease H-like domain-containing protein [Tanacetum cinerariifolium]